MGKCKEGRGEMGERDKKGRNGGKMREWKRREWKRREWKRRGWEKSADRKKEGGKMLV